MHVFLLPCIISALAMLRFIVPFFGDIARNCLERPPWGFIRVRQAKLNMTNSKSKADLQHLCFDKTTLRYLLL